MLWAIAVFHVEVQHHRPVRQRRAEQRAEVAARGLSNVIRAEGLDWRGVEGFAGHHNYLLHCPARDRRMAFPGKTESTIFESLTTKTPLTSRCLTPSEYCAGFSNVARSTTRAGSKIAISASAPTLILPFPRIIGTVDSRRCAGIIVILRSASINESAFCSRT